MGRGKCSRKDKARSLSRSRAEICNKMDSPRGVSKTIEFYGAVKEAAKKVSNTVPCGLKELMKRP